MHMFGDNNKPCFAVLIPVLEEVLKKKLPLGVGSGLATSYPAQICYGRHREFLRPSAGSQIETIPRGREARKKDAKHTVYRRTLHISKDAVMEFSRKYLEEG